MAGTGNPPNGPPCACCGQPMTYIPQHKAWYCYICLQYGTSNASAELVSQAGGKSPDITLACSKCGTRTLMDGRCPRCDTEEVITLVERLLEDVFSQGVNIAKAGPALQSAKEQFRNGSYPKAKVYAEAAMETLERCEDEYARVTDQITDADEVTAKAKRDGKDVSQAENLLNVAKSFLKTGNYEKSADYVKRAHRAAKEDEQVRKETDTIEPPGTAQEAAREGLSCPNCGGEVQTGWKRCPICTTPLSSAQPAPTSPTGMTGLSTQSAAPESKVQQSPYTQVEGIAVTTPPKQEMEFHREEDHIKAIREKLTAMNVKGVDVTQALMTLEVSRSFLQTKNLKKAAQYAKKAENLAKEAGDRIVAAQTAKAISTAATETKVSAQTSVEVGASSPAGSDTSGAPKLPEAAQAERDIEAARAEFRKVSKPADVDSNAGHRYDLAKAFLEVAELFMETGRYDKASQHAKRVLKLIAGRNERPATGSGESEEPQMPENE